MRKNISGFMFIELIAAIAVFSFGIATFYTLLFHQGKMTRTFYKNITVMQTLEGEFITIQSGQWNAYPRNKEIAYKPDPSSWKNYPRGDFFLKITDSKEYKHTVRIRLRWKPASDNAVPEKVLTGYVYTGEGNE